MRFETLIELVWAATSHHNETVVQDALVQLQKWVRTNPQLEDVDEVETCLRCEGNGMVSAIRKGGASWETCDQCRGTKRVVTTTPGRAHYGR